MRKLALAACLATVPANCGEDVVSPKNNNGAELVEWDMIPAQEFIHVVHSAITSAVKMERDIKELNLEIEHALKTTIRLNQPCVGTFSFLTVGRAPQGNPTTYLRTEILNLRVANLAPGVICAPVDDMLICTATFNLFDTQTSALEGGFSVTSACALLSGDINQQKEAMRALGQNGFSEHLDLQSTLHFKVYR